MSLRQFFKDTGTAISPQLQSGISTALSFTPIQNILLGYQQFFNAISLWDAPLTKKTLLLSAYTNLVDYLLPILLYRRAVVTFKEYSPSNSVDSMIDAADSLIMFSIVLRLYVRRVWDNTCYNGILPRAIAADNENHLQLVIHATAESVAEAVCVTHAIFIKQDMTRDILHADLKRAFSKLFSDLLVKKNPNITFLYQQLTPAIKKILNDMRHTHVRDVYFKVLTNNDLDQLTATSIANAFASLYSEEYKKEYVTSLNEIEKFFQTVFNMHDHNPVVEFKATLDKGFQAQKSFLPIKHQSPCGCNMKKIIHAGVSSPVYYAANHFYISLPEKLHNHQMISDTNFWYINGLTALVAILIYGQGLNEYKVSPEDNCTRHRYEVFARNYFHSFGVGLGFYLSLQVAVQSVYYTTGIKNYYVQDALANLIMQFGVVSMLAYNDPLPGHLNIWDFFSPFREFTAGVVAFLQRRLTPNMDVKNSRDSLIASVFSQLSSRKFRYMLDLILSGGNYFPRRELLSWGAWRENRMITQDPRRVIFDNKAFKLFYGMFKNDVEVAIQKIKIAHYCSTWVAQPMLTAIHIVGGVIALIVDVLQIMKDECLDDIMKSNKLDELLLFYRDELKKDEVNVAIYPQHTEEKSEAKVPALLPARLDSPRALNLRINPHYLDVSDEQERVILHSPVASAEVKENFISTPKTDDDEEEFTVVPAVRRSSLVANSMWGLRKLDNVVRQLRAGKLNTSHHHNAVVHRK